MIEKKIVNKFRKRKRRKRLMMINMGKKMEN